MNKRLEQEFGEHAAEKRGWHWSLTSFALEILGEVQNSIANLIEVESSDPSKINRIMLTAL